jgi:hypothetical protein
MTDRSAHPRAQTRKTDLAETVTSHLLERVDPRPGELFGESLQLDDLAQATRVERWYAMSYKFDPYWSYSDVWHGFGTQDDAEEYFQREFGEAWTLTVVDFTGMDEESVNHIKVCGVNFGRELAD